MDPWEFQEGPAEYGYDRSTGDLIVVKSFEFALRVVRLSKGLCDAGWYDASRQLFKSGTSTVANVYEAQDAESRDDFIHKMKTSAKEASETRFWLKLCKNADELPYEEGMLEDLQSIRNILASIIIKAQRNKGQ